jgi:crotonobetainyl-CoA:carnitine CoA-transferase CaiB-like acyl-CoA transferase
MQQALEGVRVLDLTTGQAGPLATMLLADSGADVVVAAHREQVAANPAAAAVWNRNKRVISDAGCDPERLRRLCGQADLVVVNSAERAGALSGLTPDQIVAASAHPVVLVMPPFLGDHPWAGELESNSLLSAAMGASALQSSFMGGPIDPVTPQLIYAQGIWAACAAVAALIERDRSGYGQVVTVSGVHGAMIAMPLRMVDDPAAVKGSTAVGPGGPSAMYSRYRCADGAWLFIAALTPKFRLIALSVLGLEHMLELDGVNGDVNVLAAPNAPFGIRDRIADAFAGKTRAEWIEIFRAADCPVGPVLDRSDWLEHPQVTALGLAVTVQDDDLGPVTMPGNPIRFEQTPITAFAARVRSARMPPPPSHPGTAPCTACGCLTWEWCSPDPTWARCSPSWGPRSSRSRSQPATASATTDSSTSAGSATSLSI